MEGLRGIIDHLQLRLAGDARHDMEALDHRSCSWLWFSNHRWPAPNQLLSEALHAISDQLLRPDRVSRASGIDAHTATALGGHTATGRTVTRASSLAQVDRVRQSQRVSDGIAGVVGSHEPPGSWWATRLKVLGTHYPSSVSEIASRPFCVLTTCIATR